jgi:N-(2-amino-2-carboxyethyl)-L-glutamate synthase
MILDDFLNFESPAVAARLRCGVRPDVETYLKMECLNPGGSIKFKPALGLVTHLESSGVLKPGCTLIDTTSGNMGIALSLVARARGYGFICVTDEKITPHNRALIEAYGAEVVVLPGSGMKQRCDYIRERIDGRHDIVWTQQFSNRANPATHERTTALELLNGFPRLDYVFIGAGTAGTLSGCARAFARLRPSVKVVAVDAEGSRHFDAAAFKHRRLPGIGATEPSPFLTQQPLHAVVIIPEEETVATCHEVVAATGWLLGASTGSVVAAIRRLQPSFRPGDVVVGIAADHGERYLDTLYNREWVASHFPGVELAAPPQRAQAPDVAVA